MLLKATTDIFDYLGRYQQAHAQLTALAAQLKGDIERFMTLSEEKFASCRLTSPQPKVLASHLVEFVQIIRMVGERLRGDMPPTFYNSERAFDYRIQTLRRLG